MSILDVNDVSIRYLIGDFKEIGLKEYALRKIKRNYHVKEFWADRHISFTLEKGDMLGIIGTNGAGKSTLLKVISGIMEPTEGSVKRQGNIAALLELGSGFDGELTVRENTYLRGAMLGYTRKFMDETYGQIIGFAELEEFQDRPFKQLSSGMKSRLAFAIASLVQPDILILDEVLSVGDGAFKKKSEAKMKEILNSGATSILVSHSVEQIREMCNKVLWLHKGEQIAFGEDVNAICDCYEQFLGSKVYGHRMIQIPQHENMEGRLKNEKTIPGKYPIKYILEEVDAAKYLVVTFSAFAAKDASIKKQYSFMNVCENIRCHSLFLQDSLGERGTYYMVSDMDFGVAEQILEFIESVRKKLGIAKERVITMGGSKGGSAALFFALKGHYGHAISMAPQTKIGSYVKNIDDTAKYMLKKDCLAQSVDVLDHIIYDLEKENKETTIHLYVSENDKQCDIHVRPLLEQMNSDRPREKIDVLWDNRIQSHGDHFRFNADYAIKKLAEILFGIKIAISQEGLLTVDNLSQSNKVYIELEAFDGSKQILQVSQNTFESAISSCRKVALCISYKDIVLFDKQIYTGIGELVHPSYTKKERTISVKFNAREDVKDKLAYALYVNRPDGTRFKTFAYQKEDVINFEIEDNVSRYSLLCFWIYERERYCQTVACYL